MTPRQKAAQGHITHKLTISSLLPLAESFSMGKCARMTQVLALSEKNIRGVWGYVGGKALDLCIHETLRCGLRDK